MKPLLLLLALCPQAAWAISPSPIPAVDARETEWSAYVAKEWSGVVSTSAVTEYLLADETRIDIYEDNRVNDNLIFDVAWEVELAAKWKEAIGQAAYYQEMSGADAGGVVLIVLDASKEKADILRCFIACKRCHLWLYTVDQRGIIRKVYAPLGGE
jgi:hypothetical protein